MSIENLLKANIREVPDFPIPGVLFKDISPIFLKPELIRECMNALAAHWRGKGVTRVLGIESRGFLFGPALAADLDAGFVIVRKQGKLPPETQSISYSLEYGNATIEILKGAVRPGDKVVIHDDLLATGGTASAAAQLARDLGAEVVGFSFLINLSFLNGEQKLNQFSSDSHWLVGYDD
ncbi:MAG: adenine phosphoribosyltransferase [Bacteroidia bacterium]|nr:adenine phosphoribosyltransferase [Bacteroidia bacterium]